MQPLSNSVETILSGRLHMRSISLPIARLEVKIKGMQIYGGVSVETSNHEHPRKMLDLSK